MLLIRPTRSIAKKLNITFEDADLDKSHSDLFCEWYCNDFKFARTDLVLFVNRETFLPLVMKAAPYRDLASRFFAELRQHLSKLGYPGLFPIQNSKIVFAKTQERSTLGVISQFIKELEMEDYLRRLQPEDTQAMTIQLSSTLIGGPKYKTPLERLAEKAGAQSKPEKTKLRLVT